MALSWQGKSQKCKPNSKSSYWRNKSNSKAVRRIQIRSSTRRKCQPQINSYNTNTNRQGSKTQRRYPCHLRPRTKHNKRPQRSSTRATRNLPWPPLASPRKSKAANRRPSVSPNQTTSPRPYLRGKTERPRQPNSFLSSSQILRASSLRKTASQRLRRARLAATKRSRGQRLQRVALNKITITHPILIPRTKAPKALRTSESVNGIPIGKSQMISWRP